MALACVLTLPLAAQPPAIGQNGVVNAASRIPPTLAGGAIARGARIAIHGVRFGSVKESVSVNLRDSHRETPFLVTTVTPEEIEAIVPLSAPLGHAELVVAVNGERSAPFAVDVAASNPGIFSRNGLGWGPADAGTIAADGRKSENSFSNPALPLEHVYFRATGAGSGDRITIVIGDRALQAERIRRDPARGEEEVHFRIPSDTVKGCNVPVYFQLGPSRASNVVTMAIGARRGNCDSGPIPPIHKGQATGIVILSRARIQSRKDDPIPVYDEAFATFTALNDQSKLSPLMLLPPPGFCTAYTSSFQTATVVPSSISAAFVAELGGRGLDAGPSLNLSAANSHSLPQNPNAPGFYARLANSDRNMQPRGAQPLVPFLEAGDYRLTGRGGKDVGAFSIDISGPTPFEWTNQSATAVVNRTRPLPLQWRGAGADRYILILATNVDQVSTAIGTTVCVARGERGQFTIPASMLANLPASKDAPGVPYDRVLLAAIPAKPAPQIAAPGLNSGAVFSVFANSRVVEFR